MESDKVVKIIFTIFWLCILAYLIVLMLNMCKPILENESDEDDDNTTSAADGFSNSDNTFDYTENFEPNDNSPDMGDNAAPQSEVANQNVTFTPPVENSNILENNVTQDDNEELIVEGTDALIAASSDRFYSIDTKGQTNRNASNDLRGDLPLAYNENYTPFNQSAIYGEPLVPTGRL